MLGSCFPHTNLASREHTVVRFGSIVEWHMTVRVGHFGPAHAPSCAESGQGAGGFLEVQLFNSHVEGDCLVTRRNAERAAQQIGEELERQGAWRLAWRANVDEGRL